MKFLFHRALGACLATCAVLTSPAWSAVPGPELGAVKPIYPMIDVRIRNHEDKDLGRIMDLGIDLINGRIVEVLVVCDPTLGLGERIVAVPPLVLVADKFHQIYRLDISTERFKTAAAIDLDRWADAGRAHRVAAVYRLFQQEPYFLQEDETASPADIRPKVPLGYVERLNRILGMAVGNPRVEKLGSVWGMTLDLPQGRILNVIVLEIGRTSERHVIPAMALRFNATRSALLLDRTRAEFEEEPRYVFTEPPFGGVSHSQEESYQGPRTGGPLEQGGSYRDADRTVRIQQDIHDAGIDTPNVQVATLNGRVTLRGWVRDEADRSRIEAIAIAASRLEVVDNQITVGAPAIRD